MNSLGHTLALLGCLVALGLGPMRSAAQGADELNTAVQQIAERVIEHLKEKRATEVAVGSVTERPPSANSSGGVAIQRALKARLTELGAKQQPPIEVSRAADFFVEGTYRGSQQPDAKLFALHMNVALYGKDASGQSARMLEIPAAIYDVADIATVLGIQVELPVAQDKPANETPEKQPIQTAQVKTEPAAEKPIGSPPAPIPQVVARHVALEKAVKEPPVRIASSTTANVDSEVTTSKSNPYAVEILVKKKGSDQFAPTPAETNDDQVFVALENGDVFRVRVHNRSHYDAGVTVALDGLSSFEFSNNQAYKKLDKWFVPRNSAVDIPGWHKSNAANGRMTFHEFEVVPHGESPASQINRTAAIGTITVAFCAAWEDDQEPPPEHLAPIETMGVGKGKLFQAEAREVKMNFGQVRTVISIRYDLPPL